MYDFRPVTSASGDLAPLQHLVDFRGLQVSLVLDTDVRFLGTLQFYLTWPFLLENNCSLFC